MTSMLEKLGENQSFAVQVLLEGKYIDHNYEEDNDFNDIEPFNRQDYFEKLNYEAHSHYTGKYGSLEKHYDIRNVQETASPVNFWRRVIENLPDNIDYKTKSTLNHASFYKPNYYGIRSNEYNYGYLSFPKKQAKRNLFGSRRLVTRYIKQFRTSPQTTQMTVEVEILERSKGKRKKYSKYVYVNDYESRSRTVHDTSDDEPTPKTTLTTQSTSETSGHISETSDCIKCTSETSGHINETSGHISETSGHTSETSGHISETSDCIECTSETTECDISSTTAYSTVKKKFLTVPWKKHNPSTTTTTINITDEQHYTKYRITKETIEKAKPTRHKIKTTCKSIIERLNEMSSKQKETSTKHFKEKEKPSENSAQHLNLTESYCGLINCPYCSKKIKFNMDIISKTSSQATSDYE